MHTEPFVTFKGAGGLGGSIGCTATDPGEAMCKARCDLGDTLSLEHRGILFQAQADDQYNDQYFRYRVRELAGNGTASEDASILVGGRANERVMNGEFSLEALYLSVDPVTLVVSLQPESDELPQTFHVAAIPGVAEIGRAHV